MVVCYFKHRDRERKSAFSSDCFPLESMYEFSQYEITNLKAANMSTFEKSFGWLVSFNVL